MTTENPFICPNCKKPINAGSLLRSRVKNNKRGDSEYYKRISKLGVAARLKNKLKKQSENL